ILKEEPPDLTDTIRNLPTTLDRVVRRCMEKNRDQRFQSARDLAFNLETLSTLSSHGTLSPSTPIAIPTVPQDQLTTAAMTGAAALAAVRSPQMTQTRTAVRPKTEAMPAP